MSILKLFAGTTAAILSPIALLCVLASLTVATLPLYRQTFAVISEPHIAVPNSGALADAAISYIVYGKPLRSEFFSNREQLHLYDIKKLVITVKVISAVLILILIFAVLYFSRINLRSLYRYSAWSFACSAIFGLAAVFLISANFETLFEFFHRITFYNNYWQLDPMTEPLIVVFPPQLFYTLSLTVVSIFIVLSALLSAFFFLQHKRT